jgi:hypothetical protein
MKKHQNYYRTIEAITHVVSKNITNRIKAEFPQNQQKGKNITKPTISKSFCRNLKLQNEAYPLT